MKKKDIVDEIIDWTFKHPFIDDLLDNLIIWCGKHPIKAEIIFHVITPFTVAFIASVIFNKMGV